MAELQCSGCGPAVEFSYSINPGVPNVPVPVGSGGWASFVTEIGTLNARVIEQIKGDCIPFEEKICIEEKPCVIKLEFVWNPIANMPSGFEAGLAHSHNYVTDPEALYHGRDSFTWTLEVEDLSCDDKNIVVDTYGVFYIEDGKEPTFLGFFEIDSHCENCVEDKGEE